jgi:hypothetical protein
MRERACLKLALNLTNATSANSGETAIGSTGWGPQLLLPGFSKTQQVATEVNRRMDTTKSWSPRGTRGRGLRRVGRRQLASFQNFDAASA